jgi:hypothetical protein
LSQQIINQLKDFVKLAIYITPISNFQSLDFEAWVFHFFLEAQHQTRPDKPLASSKLSSGAECWQVLHLHTGGFDEPRPFLRSQGPIYPIQLSHQSRGWSLDYQLCSLVGDDVLGTQLSRPYNINMAFNEHENKF